VLEFEKRIVDSIEIILQELNVLKIYEKLTEYRYVVTCIKDGIIINVVTDSLNDEIEVYVKFPYRYRSKFHNFDCVSLFITLKYTFATTEELTNEEIWYVFKEVLKTLINYMLNFMKIIHGELMQKAITEFSKIPKEEELTKQCRKIIINKLEEYYKKFGKLKTVVNKLITELRNVVKIKLSMEELEHGRYDIYLGTWLIYFFDLQILCTQPCTEGTNFKNLLRKRKYFINKNFVKLITYILLLTLSS